MNPHSAHSTDRQSSVGQYPQQTQPGPIQPPRPSRTGTLPSTYAGPMAVAPILRPDTWGGHPIFTIPADRPRYLRPTINPDEDPQMEIDRIIARSSIPNTTGSNQPTTAGASDPEISRKRSAKVDVRQRGTWQREPTTEEEKAEQRQAYKKQKAAYDKSQRSGQQSGPASGTGSQGSGSHGGQSGPPHSQTW